MKKILIVVLLFLCGGLLTFVEMKHINNQKMDYTTNVVALKHDLAEGIEIKEDDLQIVSIPNAIYNKNYFQNKNEIIGNTLAIALNESSLINKNMLLEKSYYLPSKGNAMTSLRLTPEEMLCWEIEIGENVHIVHVALEGVLSILGQVTIKGIYDQNLDQNVNIKNMMPTFILIEGKKNIIETIISKRGVGRLEVIKMTNE